MNPNTQLKAPLESAPTAVPTEAISNEWVQQIIIRRKRSALSAIAIVTVVLFGSALLDKHVSSEALLITGAIFVPLFSMLYIINAVNYPKPSPSYRQWNRVVYIYLAKLGIVFSIFRTANDVKEILNPMHGFKDPSALSRPELLLDATMSAGAGYMMYKGLKPAAYIEEYYKQQDFGAAHITSPQ
jgi:hypothetical protein